jgi:hypothetical protein
MELNGVWATAKRKGALAYKQRVPKPQEGSALTWG